jgi:hypothetical protein
MKIGVRVGWLVVLLGIGGCGNREPQLYPLTGQIHYRGRPVSGAEVGFHPLFEGPPWAPVAVTEADGSFAASTRQPGDGVLAGG